MTEAEIALIVQETRYGTDCPVSGDFDAAVRDAILAGYRAGHRDGCVYAGQLRERAERMRQHILTKVVGRLCEPSGRVTGEWGCGLCGGVGRGPADGTRDLESIVHAEDCMGAALAKNPTEFSTHPASGNAGAKSMPAETVRYDPAPERKGVIAARERLEPEGGKGPGTSPDAQADAQNDVTGRRDGHSERSGVFHCPEGWKLVPVEPTKDMLSAGSRAADGYGTPWTRTANAYKAMLDAALNPPLPTVTGIVTTFGVRWGTPCAACGKPVHPPMTRHEKAALVHGNLVYHGDCAPSSEYSFSLNSPYNSKKPT
jgi:hypothetical protein